MGKRGGEKRKQWGAHEASDEAVCDEWERAAVGIYLGHEMFAGEDGMGVREEA